MLSRCLRYGKGLRVGSVDINDWPSNNRGNNPLDLTTCAGMAFLVVHVYGKLLSLVFRSYVSSNQKSYKYTYIYSPIPRFHRHRPALRLALVLILQSRGRFVCHFGLPCGSFVVASMGSTLRSFLNPMGNPNVPSIRLGNLLTSRRAI